MKGNLNDVVEGNYCKGSNINLELFLGSASMHSDLNDLLVWVKSLEDNSLLSESSTRFLFAPQTKATWSIGKIELKDKLVDIVYADGSLEGYSSMLIRFPEHSLSIVLLNNTGISYEQKMHIVLDIARLLVVNET